MRIAIFGALSFLLCLTETATAASLAKAQIHQHQVRAHSTNADEDDKPPRKHGHLIGENGHKVPLEKKEFTSIFKQLGSETIDAVRTLQKLGGLNPADLEFAPEPRKCCCWGTPIGDKLLQLADDLDPNDNTILAQTHSHTHSKSLSKAFDDPELERLVFKLTTG